MDDPEIWGIEGWKAAINYTEYQMNSIFKKDSSDQWYIFQDWKAEAGNINPYIAW